MPKKKTKADKKELPFSLKLIIFSFILLFIFRVFNPPYLFGQSLNDGLKIIAQLISLGIIGFVIYGLVKLRFWGYMLFMIDFFIGLANHLFVIIAYLIKPEFIQQNFISNNSLLSNITGTMLYLYAPLALYWAWAAVYIYRKRELFKPRHSD